MIEMDDQKKRKKLGQVVLSGGKSESLQSIVRKGFMQTKCLEKSGKHRHRKVCCFTGKSKYDFLMNNYELKK